MLQFFNDLVTYMANTGDAADGLHGAIGSWFWWAYPANGGDTGGIVEADWHTVSWNKVRTAQEREKMRHYSDNTSANQLTR